MASSIKIFQFVQKLHQIIGIHIPHLNQKQHPTIPTRMIFLICLIQMVITAMAFLLFEATSMFEYGLGTFVVVAMINGIVIYLTLIWQLQNTFKFIENCEEFVEKSKHCSECTGLLRVIHGFDWNFVRIKIYSFITLLS